MAEHGERTQTLPFATTDFGLHCLRPLRPPNHSVRHNRKFFLARMAGSANDFDRRSGLTKCPNSGICNPTPQNQSSETFQAVQMDQADVANIRSAGPEGLYFT